MLRRLRFFGHIIRSDSDEDHTRALNDPPKKWRRPRHGRPRQTCILRAVENDLKQRNLGLGPALELMTVICGVISWKRRRSGRGMLHDDDDELLRNITFSNTWIWLFLNLPVCLSSFFICLLLMVITFLLYTLLLFMTECTCTYIQAVQKVKFVMKWCCYNIYLWFEIERNLSPPDAFYGIFYVQNPFAAGALPHSWWGGGSLPPLSALRASRFGPSGLKLNPRTQKPNIAHGRWEICRTNQNTAATALVCFTVTKETRDFIAYSYSVVGESLNLRLD